MGKKIPKEVFVVAPNKLTKKEPVYHEPLAIKQPSKPVGPNKQPSKPDVTNKQSIKPVVPKKVVTKESGKRKSSDSHDSVGTKRRKSDGKDQSKTKCTECQEMFEPSEYRRHNKLEHNIR